MWVVLLTYNHESVGRSHPFFELKCHCKGSNHFDRLVDTDIATVHLKPFFSKEFNDLCRPDRSIHIPFWINFNGDREGKSLEFRSKSFCFFAVNIGLLCTLFFEARLHPKCMLACRNCFLLREKEVSCKTRFYRNHFAAAADICDV